MLDGVAGGLKERPRSCEEHGGRWVRTRAPCSFDQHGGMDGVDGGAGGLKEGPAVVVTWLSPDGPSVLVLTGGRVREVVMRWPEG